MKPLLKASGTKRLKLKDDRLLSSFALHFNLRRYTVDACDVVTKRECIPDRLCQPIIGGDPESCEISCDSTINPSAANSESGRIDAGTDFCGDGEATSVHCNYFGVIVIICCVSSLCLPIFLCLLVVSARRVCSLCLVLHVHV